jgi:hypothetical protein
MLHSCFGFEQKGSAMSDIKHYQELLRINRRRLQVLEKQADYAGQNARADVLLEIEDLREKIDGLLAQIRQIDPAFEAPAPTAVNALNNPAPPSQPSAAASSTWAPSVGQKRELVQSLLRCPSIGDQSSRDAVVRELPPNISSRIHRDSRSNVDVLNIVNACLDYSGGLEALIDVVRFFDGGSRSMQELDATLARIFPGFRSA